MADTKEDWLADVSVDGLMMELMTYVIILLAVLGKKSSGGRHCENGSECVICREECKPKLLTRSAFEGRRSTDARWLMIVRVMERRGEERKREEAQKMGSKQS